jgi:RNA polymerase sigma factor (sigma-70 family)
MAKRVTRRSRPRLSKADSTEKTLEQMIREARFDAAHFEALVADSRFQENLSLVSQRVCRTFGELESYPTPEDLQQAVLLKLATWLPKGEGLVKIQSLKKFLYVIARRIWFDEARPSKSYQRAATDMGTHDTPATLSAAEEIYQSILIEECTRTLPRDEQEIFASWLQGKSVKAIAESLGISPAAVRYRRLKILNLTVARLGIPGYGHGHRDTRASGEVLRQRTPETHSQASPSQIMQRKLDRLLAEAGLLSEIPKPIKNLTMYRNRKPVKVKGKPISETIVEERR